MDQPQQDRRRRRLVSIGLANTFSALVLVAMPCIGGCGDSQDSGMIDNPKDVTKTPDAQDSMKGYMKQMQSKGMKPAMKAAPTAPTK